MNIYLKIYLDMNFGDDLMLLKFAEYYSNAVIYVHYEPHTYDFYTELLRNFTNVKLIRCPLREIKTYGKGFFNYIVLLGGSTLQGNSYKGCWYRYLDCVFLKKQKKYGTKYAILGCNTGPFKNNITKYFVKKELRCAEIITTRDKNSYEFISDSVRKCVIHYFPDILFDIAKNDLCDEERYGLGISVYGPAKNMCVRFLSQLCDTYTLETGKKVKLICFDVGNEDDVSAAEIIMELSNCKENISIIKHEPSCQKIISAVSGCELIIAIRFHAAIIAASLGIPFLTFSYNNKMRNFMEDIGEADKDTPLSTADALNPKNYLKKLFENPVLPKNEWRTKCDGHFKAFDEMHAND